MSTPRLAPRPTVGPLQAWSFPTPTISTLPNGLRVWRYDLPGQHIAAAHLVLDVPLSIEPEGSEGIASMTLRTSDEGSLAHPGQMLAAALESTGAIFQGAADDSATQAVLHCPAGRLGAALPLLAEIVTQPAFDRADVERHVALRLGEIERAKANSAACASTAFRRSVFAAGTRAHEPHGGTTASVSAIDTEAVRDFHTRTWLPTNATLVIAGDLPTDTDQLIADCFSDWSGDAHATHVAPTASVGRRQVTIVDRPGSVQADVRIGALSIDRTHPDWAALQVAAGAVGGMFGSRLNTVLREERGYTYGAHAGFTARRSLSIFSAGASFRTEVTADAIVETLDLLNLAAEPLQDDEVRDAVNFLVGVAPLHFDTSEPIAIQAAALAGNAQPPTRFNELRDAMLNVSTEQATAAFAEHIDPASLHIAICGDASVLIPALAERGLDAEVIEV